ncbi:hypothetical protein DVH24_039953 [Malus domestica]|uniref:Uncharacterized protein n=1 Tax=Malus domestica TaxID=3750 RepID=A0A498I6Y6_MALDO|nr:hypothetical protein DVH24_039953 [Malus domestica]
MEGSRTPTCRLRLEFGCDRFNLAFPDSANSPFQIFGFFILILGTLCTKAFKTNTTNSASTATYPQFANTRIDFKNLGYSAFCPVCSSLSRCFVLKYVIFCLPMFITRIDHTDLAAGMSQITSLSIKVTASW